MKVYSVWKLYNMNKFEIWLQVWADISTIMREIREAQDGED